LYKPAGWVSGDIYDIMRLDETHLGFYVADVVGHGMPAALFTMFIKKALLTKRIAGRTYEIVSPAASLAALNNDICEQDLSSCQFCTAVYCVMDAESLMLTYSRAGHPEPIILRAAGTVEMRRTPGSLLGIFPGEKFYPTDVKLCRGDRLLLYSDGAECGLFGRHRCNEEQIRQGAVALAGLSLDEMFAQISARINADRAANGAEDDVTVVVMDVG
jgi:sigma-B regulation protein RsbU (phosphoserine phosphatase)